MTTPQQPLGATPVDTGNPLLAEAPAIFSCTVVNTPAGQRLALTIRTPTTTLTVLLAGRDARAWAAQLTHAADSMSASGLVIANGNLP